MYSVVCLDGGCLLVEMVNAKCCVMRDLEKTLKKPPQILSYFYFGGCGIYSLGYIYTLGVLYFEVYLLPSW